MCEAESILNCRPLIPLDNDVGTEALTPNHLLLLNSAATLPPGIFDKNDHYLTRRWKQVQYLANLFWCRWRKEYVVLLNQRQKWLDTKPVLKVDDLVLVEDMVLPRNQWPLGRVVSVNSDKKGLVRSAYIRVSKCKYAKDSKISSNVILRPIGKLILLRASD